MCSRDHELLNFKGTTIENEPSKVSPLMLFNNKCVASLNLAVHA